MMNVPSEEVKVGLQNALAPTWKRELYHQIKNRNANQGNQFVQMIRDYNRLLETNRSLELENSNYEKEVARLTSANIDQQKKLRSYQDQTINSQNVPELEKKIQKLQEDLTQSYKRNSDNATMILELNQQIKVMEEDIKHKEIEIDDWKSRLQDAEDLIKRYEDQSREKDLTMQVIQEELKALQIELVKNEEKVKSLQQENNDLIIRWMQKKAEEAQKMNDAMDIAQQMISQSVKSNLQQRVEAQEEKNKSALNQKPELLDLMQMHPELAKVVVPNKLKKTTEGHKGDIYSMAYNISGSILATGGNDHLIKLWDTRSNYSARATLYGATQSVMCVNFSVNDEMVLGTSNDNTVRIWAVQQGRVRHTLTGHEGKVLTAAFTGDSNKVVSGSHDRTIKIWDLAKGYCTKTIFCYSSCNSLALNIEGRMICSGHFDHHLRFWDARGGDCVNESQPHSAQITSVTLSQDGAYVLTNSRDNTLKIVDIRTFEVVNTFSDEGYRSGANWNASCWSPDGRYVVAGSVDGKVFVWNVQNGKLETCLKNSNNTNTIYAAAWSAVNLHLSTVDKGGIISQWGN